MTKMEKIHKEIENLFKEYDICYWLSIFHSGKKYTYNSDGSCKVEDANVKDYFEWGNPKTLCMSFDADIYDVFNYDILPSCLRKFDAIIDKYGYYYEFGDAWNLTLVRK